MAKSNAEKLLDGSLFEDETGWGFQCPINAAPLDCGEGPLGSLTFRSTGWPTKAIARDRLDQHIANHRGEPMPEKAEFYAKHNLVSSPDNKSAIRLEDVS